MPIFKWVCETCGKKTRALLPQRPQGSPNCLDCDGTLMVPDTGGSCSSTSVMETRDNGLMVKKLERFANVEELVHDHGRLTDPDKSGIV